MRPLRPPGLPTKARSLLPAPATIERAGSLDALSRVHDALVTGLGSGQLAALNELVTLDPDIGLMRLTTSRTIPSGTKPAHVREIIDKFGVVLSSSPSSTYRASGLL